MQTLMLERDSRGAARVVLARAGVLNAFDDTMIAELSELFAMLGARPSVRVIMLTAEGRSICAGADISWMQRQSTSTFEANRPDSRKFGKTLQLIDERLRELTAEANGTRLSHQSLRMSV